MRKKIFTGFVFASAIIYICVLYQMLFLGFGRGMVLMSEHMLDNYNYLNSINIIPFQTISEDVAAVFDGSTRWHAIRNLIGNLLLFVPMGFFLPFFAQKMAKTKTYVIVVAAFIVAVEVIQIITLSGSLDIDDFILNLSGALIGFFVCKNTQIRSLFMFRAW